MTVAPWARIVPISREQNEKKILVFMEDEKIK